MMDTLTGRWLTEDPEGFAAGDPNLMRFVDNSPTNATDPTGLVLVAQTKWEADDYLAWLKGEESENASAPSMMLRDFRAESPKLGGISVESLPSGKWIFLYDDKDKKAIQAAIEKLPDGLEQDKSELNAMLSFDNNQLVAYEQYHDTTGRATPYEPKKGALPANACCRT